MLKLTIIQKRMINFMGSKIIIKRNRLNYSLLIAIVIIAGCASRSPLSESWPVFITKYAGDTLWSLMIFLGIGIVFPTVKTSIIAFVVLTFAFGIEFLQLYNGEFINSLRQTFFGMVVLGSGFLWSDFICYTVGVLIAVIGEKIGDSLAIRKQKK